MHLETSLWPCLSHTVQSLIWITVLDEGIYLLTHRVKNKIANQPLGALDYSPCYMLPSSNCTNREPVWWDSRGMLFITDLGTRIDDVIACLLRAHQARPFEGAQQGPSRVVISPRRCVIQWCKERTRSGKLRMRAWPCSQFNSCGYVHDDRGGRHFVSVKENPFENVICTILAIFSGLNIGLFDAYFSSRCIINQSQKENKISKNSII